MLSLFPHAQRDCEGIRRRGFLQIGALAGLGLSLPALLAQKQATAKEGRTSRDVNCILVWTRGGTSHHDTFDPKPDAAASVRGEFKVIDTAVPGVKFTEICPNFAREAKRFAVLRGWNPANGSHGEADAYVMTGHKLNPALVYPCYGSVVSHQKGLKNAVPSFVQLGDGIDHRFGGGMPGYLGHEYGPFMVLSDPNEKEFAVRDITPKDIDAGRINRRRTMLSAIDDMQQRADLQPAAFRALDEHYKAALNMITAPEMKTAFELQSEKESVRDAYGRNRFGQCCLLARRLIEKGARFVTVTDEGGWDTHSDGFKTLKEKRMPYVDQALPQLFIDLDQRGLLENTLVVWLTDFGRTPKINSASGRDHWASAGFAMMAGAGVPGGSILGRTDEEGGSVVDDEYRTEDIAATIYSKLGIPLDLLTTTQDGRPIRLNEGRVIREWM